MGAAIVSRFAQFLVGAVKSLFAPQTWRAAGPEMTVAGMIVGGLTFAAAILGHAG